MAALTFQEIRERVSIMQVAGELGYEFDKSSGYSQPCFVLKNGSKEEDKIYIKNPNNYGKSLYWRRNPSPGREKFGDVVQFIRENIRAFSEYVTARNEIDAVNRICARLANAPMDNAEIMKNVLKQEREHANRVFTINDYDREPGNWEKAMRFFRDRGIGEDTARLFKDNFELVRDTKVPREKVWWHNLGFPYRRAGSPEIAGYEIRGFGSYKNKAAGTDSTHACWQAYVGRLGTPENIPYSQIEQLHVAESAYDAMSYVQLHQGRLDLDHSVFVSVGGTFTNELMAELFRQYPGARPVLHFDNDYAGIMYDIRAACIYLNLPMKATVAEGDVRFNVGEKAFSIPQDQLSYDRFIKSAVSHTDRPDIRIEKSPGDFKDWNEVLQTAMAAEKTRLKPEDKRPAYGSMQRPAPPPPGEEGKKGIKI